MLKNLFVFTFLFSAVFTLVLSPVLSAQSDAPGTSSATDLNAVIFVPYQAWLLKVKSFFEERSVKLDYELNQQHYKTTDQALQFDSDRVAMNAEVKTNLIQSTASSDIHVQLQLQSAQVTAVNFNLVGHIKKDLGFGTAVLNFKMHCDQIKLDLNNSNTIAAEIKIEQNQISVPNINWNLDQTQVQTQLTNCDQIAGFDQTLKEQIQKNINQSFVHEALQQLINQKINQALFDKMTEALKKYATQFNLKNTQKQKFDDQKNMWLYSGSQIDTAFSANEISQLQQSQRPTLLIKKKALEEMLKLSVNQFLTKQGISSNEQSGLHRLTCSRLVQTFIWPSLKSLGRCFEMKIQNQIQELSLSDFANFKLDIKMGSWASGENKNLAYFETNFSTNFKQAKASLNSFRAQADPEFIKWSGRSKRISTGLMLSSLKKILQISVQQIQISETFKLIQKNTNLRQMNSDTLMAELGN